MKAYHFTKDIREGFVDYYKEICNGNITVCFDFEDSIQDKGTDVSLKAIHRRNVIKSISELASVITSSELGFRINKYNSNSYQADILAINSLQSIKCIFIPKIESAVELNNILRDIKVQVSEIIPVIETVKGIEGLEEILAVKDVRFSAIAFGHCDFNLSMGKFPFSHQDSDFYWQWLEFLNDNCLRYNIGLINSPVLELANNNLFFETLQKCKKYNSISGQVTLCKEQTLFFRHLPPQIGNRSGSVPKKYLTAEEVIYQYETFRLPDRSFAINNEKVLISPQEYQSAIKNHTV